MDAVAVPFTLTRQGSDAYISIETRGVLRTTADGIAVEFLDTVTDYRDPHVPAEKEPLREILIPLGDIDSVTYGRRTLRASMIELRCTRMAALADVPFADGNRITVRVARADRERAREFATTIDLALADQRLRRLDRS